MEPDIEIVIPHVDGAAPGYEAAFRAHAGDWVPSHVRDLGELRYVLRSLERYAPWARSVTLAVQDEGHVPAWLDRTRVRIVRHDAFIPAALLPTFHWATIVAHLYRIEGLAERFVIWEDDQMLGRPVEPDDLYAADGLPRASRWAPILPALGRVLTSKYQLNLTCTARLLDRELGPGAAFLYPHMPLPATRSAWREMVERFGGAPEFRSTVTRRSRGDERAEPTVDPAVVFVNWVERAKRRRSAVLAWAACLLGMAGRGAVAALPPALRRRAPLRAASYGIVNDPARTARRMARLAAERATFINVNDDAYDSWVEDGVDWNTRPLPNTRSLEAFRAAMERLYPERSRFELAGR